LPTHKGFKLKIDLEPFDVVKFSPGAHADLGAFDALLNIEAIKNLKSRYLAAVDDKDWGAMNHIFTEDAVIDFSGEDKFHVGHHGMEAHMLNPAKTVVIGGQAAAQRIARAVQEITTVHQCHDAQIALTSRSSAIGKWSLYDQLDYGNEIMHGYGHYHEHYELTETGWRIASLLLTRIKVDWELRNAG
jgi:hypothetical protein